MNKKTFLIAQRAAISIALCFSLIAYSNVSGSYAATRAALEIKRESQYRSEAALYERAIREIASIASMKLETADDLKKAASIVEGTRPNLQFASSKLIVMAISDSTFSAAVKKRTPDKQTAEAFLKTLSADTKSVLKLEGAQTLETRMQQSLRADAETLKRSGTRLKEAAEKFRKATQGRAIQDLKTGKPFDLARVSVSAAHQPAPVSGNLAVLEPAIGWYGDGLIVGLLIAVVVITIIANGTAFKIVENLATQRDAVGECLAEAARRVKACVDAAQGSLFALVLILQCDAQYLLDAGECLVNP